MKSLLIILLLLISTCYYAQDRVVLKHEVTSDRAKDWMTNIATNSQMRFEMMQIMIEQTADKHDEMLQLVNQILDNFEMKKMIREAPFHNAVKANNSITIPGIMKKDNIIMKKTEKHKKPIVKL